MTTVQALLYLIAAAALASVASAAPVGEAVSVKSFGAVGDGAADDIAAIQKANDSVRHTRGTVYLPVGTYNVTSMDLTNIDHGFALTGEGPNATRLMPARDGVVVLDVTGSRSIKLESFQLGAYNQATTPAVAILLAQVDGNVSNAVDFERLYITGKCSIATLYCCGVPGSTMIDCDFYNYYDGPVPVVAFTHDNYAGVKSAYTSVFSGDSHTSDWTLVACEIYELSRPGGKTQATALRLDGTTQMRWIGGNVSGAGPQLVHLSDGPRCTVFYGTTFYSETETLADAIFYNSDRTECVIVTGCLPQASKAIFTGVPSTVCDEVDFACKPTAAWFRGLIFDCPEGKLVNSTIRCDGLGLRVKTITDTVLINPGKIEAATSDVLTVGGKDSN